MSTCPIRGLVNLAKKIATAERTQQTDRPRRSGKGMSPSRSNLRNRMRTRTSITSMTRSQSVTILTLPEVKHLETRGMRHKRCGNGATTRRT